MVGKDIIRCPVVPLSRCFHLPPTAQCQIG